MSLVSAARPPGLEFLLVSGVTSGKLLNGTSVPFVYKMCH